MTRSSRLRRVFEVSSDAGLVGFAEVWRQPGSLILSMPTLPLTFPSEGRIMFFFVVLLFALLMFSGGGYYGHRQGYYGRRSAYGGIGIGWLVVLLVLLFLMPQWGYMRH